MGRPVTAFQILTPAPDEHAAFYSKLFGWSVNADNPLGYRQFDTGSEQGIQGGVWPAPPQATPMVQLLIEVEDAVGCVSEATALGAQTLIPVQTLPQGEKMAVMRDPQGLPFAVFQPFK